MDILQLLPPKQLTFTIPHDCQRQLTLTNQTLHSVGVLLMCSHPHQIVLSTSFLILQAFEEKQVTISLNWSQDGRNLSSGRLRVVYRQMEEEEPIQKLCGSMTCTEVSVHAMDLSVVVDLNMKSSEFSSDDQGEGETISESINKGSLDKYYLMKRISHLQRPLQMQVKIDTDQDLRNEILHYLQGLPNLISIHPCPNNSFLLELKDPDQNCQLTTFTTHSEVYTFVLSKIIAYGQIPQVHSLLLLHNSQHQVPEVDEKVPQKQGGESEKKGRGEQEILKREKEVESSAKEGRGAQKSGKKGLVKQTFVGSREGERRRFRRRNKSEEKIIERESDDEEEGNLFREQMQELKRLQVSGNGQRGGGEWKETSVEFTQKILNLFLQEEGDDTYVYVVMRDCVRCLALGNPSVQRIIKFDAIYQQNVAMPCPVDKYQDELIFGNETILYWVNLSSKDHQWKYVQRKYIYALAVIQELSLVAVGGKNFSKLAYFGKETTRTNIKLYSCSSNDKHEHLFTYDIPGEHIGNIVNMAYLTVPPHSTKLLLLQTLNPSSHSTFHFLRVKAFNKVEVYGQIDLEELGILNLIRFRHNDCCARVVCMEALGETRMDSFKRLKLKCQYQKVEVSTEGFKFPLKKYSSFQLGGGRGTNREWMSLIDQDGVLYVFDFKTSTIASSQLYRSDIRQAFSVNNGKKLLLSTEGTLLIRTSRE